MFETGAVVIVAVFVIAVLALVGYVLFKLSPFAHHTDVLRDPLTRKRRFDPPRL